MVFDLLFIRECFSMNCARVTLLSYFLLFFICSCKCPIGPPFPEKHARIYLESQGKSNSFISKVNTRERLSEEEFQELSDSPDINVRHLIASNPYISMKLLKKLAQDKDMFVRYGVAGNISISKEVIEFLKNGNSKRKNDTVLGVLVGNPSVPQETILELYDENDIGLRCFAINPNCPERIKQDIRNSWDSGAKKYVEDVERWRKEGKYDSRGVWIEQ